MLWLSVRYDWPNVAPIALLALLPLVVVLQQVVATIVA
jgi:hypothetical protein